MLPALLIVAALFAVLFVVRIGASRRAELLRRWPAVVLAAAAALSLARGAVWPGLALAAAAALAWVVWPRLDRPKPPSGAPGRIDPREAEARALLGVGLNASESEIRRAYRDKIARAHPDRGGAHAEAARLTAARDLLLKKKT